MVIKYLEQKDGTRPEYVIHCVFPEERKFIEKSLNKLEREIKKSSSRLLKSCREYPTGLWPAT
jgi:hypothetical protein